MKSYAADVGSAVKSQPKFPQVKNIVKMKLEKIDFKDNLRKMLTQHLYSKFIKHNCFDKSNTYNICQGLFFKNGNQVNALHALNVGKETPQRKTKCAITVVSWLHSKTFLKIENDQLHN
jgi:hypothetical protein